MNNRLYIGNLSYSSTQEELEALFEKAGTVVSCLLMMDKFTGRSRGFAFVEMDTEAEAQMAIEQTHGKDFGGRSLCVNIAKPLEDRSK